MHARTSASSRPSVASPARATRHSSQMRSRAPECSRMWRTSGAARRQLIGIAIAADHWPRRGFRGIPDSCTTGSPRRAHDRLRVRTVRQPLQWLGRPSRGRSWSRPRRSSSPCRGVPLASVESTLHQFTSACARRSRSMGAAGRIRTNEQPGLLPPYCSMRGSCRRNPRGADRMHRRAIQPTDGPLTSLSMPRAEAPAILDAGRTGRPCTASDQSTRPHASSPGAVSRHRHHRALRRQRARKGRALPLHRLEGGSPRRDPRPGDGRGDARC